MRRRPASPSFFESLEARVLADAVAPTALEQYFVELVNRARLDPDAEAARYGIDLNEGLTPGTLAPDPRQPLAINPYLVAAAREHSQYLGVTPSARGNPHFRPGDAAHNSPTDRAVTAGYTGGLAGYENIAWSTSTSLSTSVADFHHKILFMDFIPGRFEVAGRGHRKNLLVPGLTEIGIGMGAGDMAFSTQDFAAGPHYLTGVIYADVKTKNNFYTPGEGVGGVTVTATPTAGGDPISVTSWASGGYSLQLPNGTYHITASGDSLAQTLDKGDVTINNLNQKVDFVLDALPPPPPPDLVAQLGTLTLPTPLVPGDKLTIPVVVTNNGAGPAGGGIPVSVFLSDDDTFEMGFDTRVGATTTAALASGASRTVKVPVTLGAQPAPGNHYFFAVVDPLGQVPETNDTNNASDPSAPQSVAWQFGQVGQRKNIKLTLNLNNDLTPTTFTLKGPGTGTVGDDATPDLTLTGTSAASQLAVVVKKIPPAGDGETAFDDVTIDGPIQSVTMPKADVLGDFTINGGVKTIKLDDFLGDGELSIGAPVLPTDSVSLTFDEVVDASVVAPLATLKAVTATAWRSDQEDSPHITAKSLGTLKIKGDAKRGILGTFAADLDLTDLTVRKTLGSAAIAGAIDGATLRVAGNSGAIKAGALRNARVLVGVLGNIDAPDDPADFNPATTGGLASLTITDANTALPNPAPALDGVVNALIAARTLGTISLRDVKTTNPTPFGITTRAVASYTRKDALGKVVVKLAKLKTPTLNAEPTDADQWSLRLV